MLSNYGSVALRSWKVGRKHGRDFSCMIRGSKKGGFSPYTFHYFELPKTFRMFLKQTWIQNVFFFAQWPIWLLLTSYHIIGINANCMKIESDCVAVLLKLQDSYFCRTISHSELKREEIKDNQSILQSICCLNILLTRFLLLLPAFSLPSFKKWQGTPINKI